MFGRRIAFAFILGFVPILALRAQIDLTSSQQIGLPSGHSFTIGLNGVGANLVLSTIDEVYSLSGVTNSWTKINSFRSLGILVYTDSRVATQFNQPGYLYVTTFGAGDAVALYTMRQAPPAASQATFAGFSDVPRSTAISGDGTRFYFSDADGQLWRANDAQLTNLTLLATTTALTQLRLGSDGSVYGLGGDRQVFRFSADGDLLNQYTLSHNTESTAQFAISSTGLLYTMDLGSSYSSIYDALTGAYVGRYAFDSSDTNPASQGGVNMMDIWVDPATGLETLAAQTGYGANVNLYDVTGLTAVPEPSTYATLAGLAALGLVIVRRRRA